MGNLSSSCGMFIRRRLLTRESLRQSNEDLLAVNQTGVGVPEFFSLRKRRVALGAMLVCQLFDWVAFTIVTVWIPLSLQLNIFFINVGEANNKHEYTSYLYRVQMISVLSLVILYSSGWIAGILMDAWWRKTIFVLVSLIFVAAGFGYSSAMVVTIGEGINCTATSNISYECRMTNFALCLTKEANGGSCLTAYIAVVCFISVLSAVIRTALPALGGDQIPERNGVRAFYAQFYWCQKAGETISSILCITYLYTWSSYIQRTAREDDPDINTYKKDYNFLFYGWAYAIGAACFLSLVAVSIVVFGKLTRQVRPDVSVIKDTFMIWIEAFKRRNHLDEDSHFLDASKRSKGGSYADQAVEDRRRMMKYSLVLLLLVPVAFATTLPTLPKIPTNSTAPLGDWLEQTYNDTFETVICYLVMYTTSCLAIPAIHKLCSCLSNGGRPLTLLHRFILGHGFMILGLCADVIAYFINKGYEASYTEFKVICQITQMVCLGICNAFIYTTGYELTMLSAPRAMQGVAMGLFYLMDGAANMINLAIITNIEFVTNSHTNKVRLILSLAGGIGPSLVCIVLLILLERRYNLGLSTV